MTPFPRSPRLPDAVWTLAADSLGGDALAGGMRRRKRFTLAAGVSAVLWLAALFVARSSWGYTGQYLGEKWVVDTALWRWWVNVLVPFAVTLLPVPPIRWVVFRWREAGRFLEAVRSGQACAVCGYDLRATPDRCPECGTPAGGVVR